MLLFIYFVVFICVVVGNEEYKGHKVYRVEVDSQAQQDRLSELKDDLVDFWTRPSYKHGMAGLAMVPPSHFLWFEEQLEKLNITKNVFIEDVYEHIIKESDRLERKKRSLDDDQQNTFDIKRYNRFDDILNYMRTLAETYNTPASRVELVEYGMTLENRPLVYLKVTSVNIEVPTVQKQVIVVEAGINPREWITIPAVLNVVERILAEPQYLQAFDWVIMPVVNPDGYEYTHTNLRLWTKTRSINSNWGHICPGVNINRNFDVDWQNFDASSSPCSHLYAGTEPFSEVETQMVKSIIDEYGTRIKLYLSLQNKGGFISYPWNYERAASGMFVQHHLLGVEIVKAISEAYSLDVGSTIFDRASGTSTDFARRNNILYTFNIDIVQRDSVIIPEEDIESIVDDVWKAVAVATNQMITLN